MDLNGKTFIKTYLIVLGKWKILKQMEKTILILNCLC